MRKFLTVVLVVVFASIGLAGPSSAFMLGEETKGVKVKMSDEVDLKIRIRLQPRLDFGDIKESEAGNKFENESDMYFRRVRLEFKAHMTKKITFQLDLKADKRAKTGQSSSDTVKVHHVFIDYKFNDMAILRIGEKKLPYTRVAFTSSSKQLLVDRPEVIDNGAKKFFPYEDPMVMLRGKFAEGALKYFVAVSDGRVEGDSTLSTESVDNSDPLYVVRVVVSPPGWVEKKQSDAHLGKGRHIAFGANYAFQNDLEYDGGSPYEEDRKVWTIDLSGHLEGFSAQAEYAEWRGESSKPGVAELNPQGWYAQAGYFFKGPDIEPAVRYEIYDHDANQSDKEEQVFTLGLNWYPKGHSAKVQINWVRHDFDDGLVAVGSSRPEDSKDVFKVQGQFYF